MRIFWILVLSVILLIKAETSDSSRIITVSVPDTLEPNNNYKPTWDSLDRRPLPQWYDEAKFGIFIHWGVFSVPSFGSEWFWHSWKENQSQYVDFMKKNYPPDFTYQDFARDFTAEFYNPEEWAELFQSSGAKYVVLTSKHHEGFTMWPSKTAFSWNAMDVGPHRDLVGDLEKAIRGKTDIKFGLYHSLFEWYNPLFLQDESNNFSTQHFVNYKTMPELYELAEKYKPEVIWSDGSGGAVDSYWTSRQFLAWLFNESPVKDTVVVNDRWGVGTGGKHGSFFSYGDRYNPGVLQKHKWENCMTIDKVSWGYRRNAKLSDYLTMEELVKTLAETVSCGGNLLMNVGPTKDGIITPIYEERLRGMGEWLKINGEAIYSSKPWIHQNDTVTSGVWYTQKGNTKAEKTVYAIVLNWPQNYKLKLGAPELLNSSSITITMLGYSQDLEWTSSEKVLQVQFPNKAKVTSNWAWVLKMTPVDN